MTDEEALLGAADAERLADDDRDIFLDVFVDGAGERVAISPRAAVSAEIDGEDIIAFAREIGGEGAAVEMPRISILREAVDEHHRPLRLMRRREALPYHAELLRRRHDDIFDELDALLTVDGLFDDFGA